MKQCPSCRTTYTDDSLSYCLSDGTALVVHDDDPTVVRGKDKVRIGIPFETERARAAVVPADSKPSPSSMKWLFLIGGGLLLAIAAVAVLGLAGAAFYFSSTPDHTQEVPRTPTPRATVTPDLEKDRLREEIANIQKRLEEQKKAANNTGRPAPDDGPSDDDAVIATVNSPNDGFLALRNYPDAERGERLAKIPNGAAVEILNCEKRPATISGRRGQWCQVEYAGQNGWVFDAWLDR
jgi:hypothetical protein